METELDMVVQDSALMQFPLLKHFRSDKEDEQVRKARTESFIVADLPMFLIDSELPTSIQLSTDKFDVTRASVSLDGVELFRLANTERLFE
jgi:hypothetical protein